MDWKLILFVVFAFIFVAIMAIVQMTTNLSFELIVLPQFAPTLAYLLIILLFKDMFKPIIVKINKQVLVKTLIAIFLPLVLFTMTFSIGRLIGIETSFNENLLSVMAIGLLGMIIGCTTEEIGWRSFLQPSLEQKHSVFISSLIVGLIWGIWHIGHFQNGLIFMLGFLVFTISVSIIIVFLQKDTQHNLIISSIFHLAINICFAIYFSNGFGNTKLFIVNSFIWLITAVIIVICNRKYMFTKETTDA